MVTRPDDSDTVLESGPVSASFPEARAIEAWLESLGSGGPAEPGNCRFLFILDNDFGELTTVMYLILGQECFRDSRILLSPRLYRKDSGTLWNRVGMWKSEADLAESIATYRPKVVVFASGYLMPVHNLLTSDALARLCDQVRRDNGVVVTADPFLGVISQWADKDIRQLISIDIPENANETLVAVKQLADAKLHQSLSEAERVLRTAPHLYPSHTDMESARAAEFDRRNVAFFNDALLLPPPLDAMSDSGGPRHWMFTISEVDYQTQAMFLGADGFAAIVANLLSQTARLGRHAIFLGPTELLRMVKPVLGRETERIHLLEFCSFRQAMSLLLSAEYSFYWNVVSHSILMQLWNGRPVILFNRGHLARAVPAIYERVIAWYYQGWEPPYLDHTAPLSLPVLERAVASHGGKREDLMARFRRALSPAGLCDSLLAAQAASSAG